MDKPETTIGDMILSLAAFCEGLHIDHHDGFWQVRVYVSRRGGQMFRDVMLQSALGKALDWVDAKVKEAPNA